jgi:hypothetical protein
VRAIESLAEKHPQCEVAFIGTGERNTSFEGHTLASFPTHEPHKRKRIAWAWIKTEDRARRVAIAEIRSEKKMAYALEIERTNQEHAILVLARNDLQRIGAGELESFRFHWKIAVRSRSDQRRPEGNLELGGDAEQLADETDLRRGISLRHPQWKCKAGGRPRSSQPFSFPKCAISRSGDLPRHRGAAPNK